MALRVPRLVLAAAIAAALIATQLSSAAPAGAGMGRIIDFEEAMAVDCETAQLTGPEAISTNAVAGPTDVVNLDALVMVDVAQGAKIAAMADPEARKAAKQALFDSVKERLVVGRQSYEGLSVDLRYDDFKLLAPLNADGTPRERTDNAQEIIDLSKAQLGGARPADIDVVYTVTDLDIQLPDIGNAVAGLADCIGGVALPDRAFAVGEMGVLIEEEGGIPIGPIAFYKDLTAKIAAHEVGHLMGGHHHYQECGTAAPTAAERGEPGPCTLMTNAVDFQTLPFSTLNGAVVRGHAEEFAAANDAPPAGAARGKPRR